MRLGRAAERLVLGGGAAFETGSVMWWLVLPVVAVQAAGASAAQTSALITASTVANLVAAVVTGHLGDRWGAVVLLRLAPVLRGICLGVLLVLVASGTATVPALGVVAVGLSLSESAYGLAQTVLVPQVVPDARLAVLNGRLRATESSAQVGGSLVGGWLIGAAGVVAGVLADLLATAGSCAAAFALRGTAPTTAQAAHDPDDGPRSRGTWRAVWVHPVLRRLLLSQTSANFFASVSVAAEASFLLITLSAGGPLLGAVYALGSVGGIVGGLLAARSSPTRGRALASCLALSGTALALALAARPGALALMVGVGNLLSTCALVVFSVATVTIRQRTVAVHELGRVSAVFRTVGAGSIPIGSATGTALVAASGPRFCIGVACLGLVASALLLRGLDRSP